MHILYSPKFLREYKKLPMGIKDIAEEREAIFRENPFAPILGTHKLRGRLKDFWSFSLDFRHRIIFEFTGGEVVRFHSVGDHDVYG